MSVPTRGVRPVIHPHAGGYIEFADEIEKVVRDIPYEVAGLCLDTGHLYYSHMDPVEYLKKYADKLDYVHFKDVNETVYRQVLGERIRFFDGCGKGAMCPIGTGSLDYPAIKQALSDIGYAGYITNRAGARSAQLGHQPARCQGQCRLSEVGRLRNLITPERGARLFSPVLPLHSLNSSNTIF